MASNGGAGQGRLSGKVAIITGGGSGFGAETARTFAREGASIMIGDINVEGAEKTSKSIADAAGDKDKVMVQKMDVTKEADWKAAVEACTQKFGRLDIVVNNAGWSYKNKPTLEVTEEEFDRVFLLNVKSVYLSANATIPYLRKQGSGGSIINIGSVSAYRPRGGLTWYSATKAAVGVASKALATEYGPDQIRLNTICPLLSGTGLFEQFIGEPYSDAVVKKAVDGKVPLGRLTDPKDVANTALWLASEESSFVTGQDIILDGGKSVP